MIRVCVAEAYGASHAALPEKQCLNAHASLLSFAYSGISVPIHVCMSKTHPDAPQAHTQQHLLVGVIRLNTYPVWGA